VRASHVIAGIVGIVACFAIYVFSSVLMDTLAADATDDALALWVYTPHAEPGDAIHTKLRAERGAAIGVVLVKASIDGRIVLERAGEGRTWNSLIINTSRSRPHVEREYSVPLSPELPPGEHNLTFDVDYVYAAPGHDGFHDERAHGRVLTKIDVPPRGGAIFRRLLSLLRAILTVALAFLVLRRAWPHIGAWANASDASKSGGALLGSFFIALIVAWGIAGYPAVALPLAAGVGTPDYVIVVAMAGWFVLPIVSFVKRARPRSVEKLFDAKIRIVETVEPASEPGGYREGAARPQQKRTLDEVCEELWYLKLRRRGDRTTQGRFAPVQATFVAADGDDIARGLALSAPFDTIARAAPRLAAIFGPIEITLRDKTVRVDEAKTYEDVLRELAT
jgi:hypothetical protein